MPENEKTETKLEKFEREQMSRRAALRKIGYTSALATLALFGADDVMRLVGQKMQQQARNNQVADIVARELREAGVAIAAIQPACAPDQPTCQHCENELYNEQCWCNSTYGNPQSPYYNTDTLARCSLQAVNNNDGCFQYPCCGKYTTPSNCTTFTEPPGWSG